MPTRQTRSNMYLWNCNEHGALSLLATSTRLKSQEIWSQHTLPSRIILGYDACYMQTSKKKHTKIHMKFIVHVTHQCIVHIADSTSGLSPRLSKELPWAGLKRDINQTSKSKCWVPVCITYVPAISFYNEFRKLIGVSNICHFDGGIQGTWLSEVSNFPNNGSLWSQHIT